MHGGHETLGDAEVVVDDLGQRGQTVGGARRVAQDVDTGLVLVLVHSHHKHGRVCRGRGNDHLQQTTNIQNSRFTSHVPIHKTTSNNARIPSMLLLAF